MIDKLVKFFKSRKPVAAFIIIFAIIFEIAISIIYKLINPADPAHYMEILYYSSQVVSCTFVISGVVIAVWQYYLSSRSAKTNLEVVQVQRAIDLASYYKDNILRFQSAISYIYSYSGISEIMNKINPEDLEYFDEAEMQKLLSEKDQKRLDKLTETEDFIKAFLKANSIYNLGFYPEIYPLNDDHKSQKEDDSSFPCDPEIITAYVGNLFCDVLNNMEFFSMHFSHNTADESVVYQSLHQTYLEIVHLLYFKIARANKASASKYYTNVIWLYKKWMDRKQKQDSNFLNGMRSLTENGTIIQK